jgi:hypothetical protein
MHTKHGKLYCSCESVDKKTDYSNCLTKKDEFGDGNGYAREADFDNAEHEAVFAADNSRGENGEAIEWCEEHFINSLDWEIRPNWSDISIQEAMDTELPLVGDDEIINALCDDGIRSLEDFRLRGIKALARKQMLEKVIYGSFLLKGIDNMISEYYIADSDDDNNDFEYELPFK